MDLNQNQNNEKDSKERELKNEKKNIFKIIIPAVIVILVIGLASYFYLENKKVSENTKEYIEYAAEMSNEIYDCKINLESISFSNDITSTYVENGYYWGMDVIKDYGESIFAEDIAEEKIRFENINSMYENINSIQKTDESINTLRDKIDKLYNEYKIVYEATINGGANINFSDFDKAVDSVNQELEKLGYKAG